MSVISCNILYEVNKKQGYATFDLNNVTNNNYKNLAFDINPIISKAYKNFLGPRQT